MVLVEKECRRLGRDATEGYCTSHARTMSLIRLFSRKTEVAIGDYDELPTIVRELKLR